MEEEKDKFFIKPLTPVLVDENIVHSDDVYFKTFDLVIEKLDKKTRKRLLRIFIRKASEYTIYKNSKDDIKEKYKHLKRLFNIKILFPKKMHDPSSKELQNNDISFKNKHYDEACKYHEAIKIFIELNHFLKILYEEEKGKYDLKSYDFLKTQLKEEKNINKPVKDITTEIDNLVNYIDKTSKKIITKLKNYPKEDETIITKLIDYKTTEIDNSINKIRELWKNIINEYKKFHCIEWFMLLMEEIDAIKYEKEDIYNKCRRIKEIYNLLKNELKNQYNFITEKFDNIFIDESIKNIKDASGTIDNNLSGEYQKRKKDILALLDDNISEIEKKIKEVDDNFIKNYFIEIKKQSEIITEYDVIHEDFLLILLIIDEFINWLYKQNNWLIQLTEVKSFSDLLSKSENDESFIIETNKQIKFKQILNSFIEFLKKEISINSNELIFINEKFYNIENRINPIKKIEIIEEICKNNRLTKLEQSLTEIEEINIAFINIFTKLKKDNFLNSILDEYMESFNEQKEKISQNKKLIKKIYNVISNQKNLIKINEIYEETKNKFLFYINVNNVAITGLYGSGKSSIINTYLNRNLKLNEDVIRITLTHFSYADNNYKTKTEEESYSLNTVKENAIEEEIISELVYQINPNKIYLSPYKIKKNIKPLLLGLLKVSSVFLFLIYLFLVICLSFKCDEHFFCESDFWKNILIFSPVVSLSFLTFYVAVKYRTEITRIKLLDQIDIQFKQEKYNLSKFDKEYRELVYIIKNSKKRIIIFEDLDRLENFNFLTKLRKINDILNRDKPLKSTRFKFIYVMKDDLFIQPEDKTKFFDLIIPVVPFKNIDNIKNIFKNLLSKFFIDNEFISNISEYISDNRLAVNICNEFNIYFQRIKTNFAGADIDLNMEDFFLLIVFKNIFPELFNSVFLNNKKNLSKKINNKNSKTKEEQKYKELYKEYYSQFNNISYEDFYTYTSDYFVEEADKNWLIYLNKSNEEFDSEKHNLIIEDLDYIIRFSKLNLIKNKEIKNVIKNVDFINKILFKLGRDRIELNKKENELIFNYFLKNNENSKLVLRQFFKENSKTKKLTFNFLMNFFTNIIRNDYQKYKEILFNILISSEEFKENIFLNLKISFLYSLIFSVENNYGKTIFSELIFEDFVQKHEISKKEKEFLLFLNSNPYNYKLGKFIINNDLFLQLVNLYALYDEEYIKYFVKFIDKENLFLFFEDDEKLSLETEYSKGINFYFEKQKHFLQILKILDSNKNNFFNYGRILSGLKQYKNLYNYYFNFIIHNFIYFLADVFNRRPGLSISEDEGIILQILNSDKLKTEHKEIYISYIEEETLNKIDSNEIKNKKIRDFFEKQKNEKNKY